MPCLIVAWAAAADPANPDRWYAAVSDSPFAAHGTGDGHSRLLRSEGNGWQRIDTWDASPELRRMPYTVLAPAPERILVGLRGGALMWSEDAGESWRRLSAALPDVIAIAGPPAG